MTTLTINTNMNIQDQNNIPSYMPVTICLSTINWTIKGCAMEKGVMMTDNITDHQKRPLNGRATLSTLNNNL
jgi:hypothetical protein